MAMEHHHVSMGIWKLFLWPWLPARTLKLPEGTYPTAYPVFYIPYCISQTVKLPKGQRINIILMDFGGIPTPLKNMKVSWNYYPQYIMEQKHHV